MISTFKWLVAKAETLLKWKTKYIIIKVTTKIKIFLKLCEPFCKTLNFWHCSAIEYYPTLIISIGAVFWHQYGNEWFTRICTEPTLCKSEIWLLLLDGSCYASWRHFECWEFEICFRYTTWEFDTSSFSWVRTFHPQWLGEYDHSI